MSSNSDSKAVETGRLKHGIVLSVFEDFLNAVRDQGALTESAAKQLHTVLLERHDLSAEAIRDAIFAEEETSK